MQNVKLHVRVVQLAECQTAVRVSRFAVCYLHVRVPRTKDDGRYLAERTSATENAGRTRLLDRPKINTNHNA